MKVLINDPLQQIVDPRFMFLFKNHIKLKAELHETGKISDFMSTQLNHDTQEKLWNDRGFHGNKLYAEYEGEELTWAGEGPRALLKLRAAF